MGIILEISSSIEYYSGFKRNELIGTSVSDIYFNLEDREILLNEIIKNGKIRNYELKLKSKTNEIKYVSINARLILNADGIPSHIHGAVRDITQGKLSENALHENGIKYSTLVENSPDAIIIYMDGKIVFVNKQSLHLMAIESPEELIGKNGLQFIHPDFRKKAIERMRKVTTESLVLPFMEEVIIRPNGSGVDVEIKAIPIILNGKPAAQLIIRDVTGRKEVEIALNNSKQELRKFATHHLNVREEEKIDLAREIHDDLGQILVALKIDIGMFKQKISKSKEVISSEILLSKFDRLSIMIDKTIKTTRRIMNGLRPEMIDSMGFIEAGKSYIVEFEERHHLNCQFESTIKELKINPQQSVALFRILQESLTNIAKHARATSVKIQLDNQDDKLIMEIIDNGIGFDENNKGRHDSYGMIGMKERVILLEGTLNISSKVGQGTCVRVEIPYNDL